MKILRAIGTAAIAALGMAAIADFAGPVSAADTKAEKKAKRLEALKKGEPAAPSAPTPQPKPAPVKPLTQDPVALAARIDHFIDEKLAAAKLDASPVCSDAEFIRRASLDITGVIPTAEKAKAFLDDKSPDKRAKLIDQLLADEHYGRKQSDIWTPKLYARDSANRFVQREPFQHWIRDQFNANTPWNKFVATIIDANGTVDKNPEVTFYLANRTIDKLTDDVTQHFMGVRLGCAQCHNHPFTDTKQTEYWGMAAFFSKVAPDRPGNANKGADNTALGVKEGTTKTKLKDFFPESAKTVPPKFLGGAEPKLTATEAYRPVLAAWLTSATNPFFSKAIVNRTWAQYFGNGIVDPIDDMISTRTPSHPELLNELAEHFARTGFDLKYLVRSFCLTNAYQRSGKASGNNAEDHELFSHQNVKLMSAEELYDSLAVATGGGDVNGGAGGAGKKAAAAVVGKGQPNTPRDRFVAFFLAGNEESNPTEYEAGIPQALKIMNSKLVGPQSMKQFGSVCAKPAEVLEKMYLSALSRRPTPAEIKTATDYVAKVGNATDAYGDLFWALLNSSEFRMIR